MVKVDLNRREFLKIAAGTGAALAMPTSGRTFVSSKMIGIQVGAVSFVDEGTEKVLDVLQERARVNTLFLAVFTYGRGIAGRQIPGQPLAPGVILSRKYSEMRLADLSGAGDAVRELKLPG